MPFRDPRCVHVASTMGEAEVTASCLASQGIPARVMDAMTLGGLEGIVSIIGNISSRGIEVWVDNPDQLTEALRVLQEHKSLISHRAETGKQHGPVEMICDKCGKPVKFKAEDYGTIQECPRCGHYLDVGPTDESDDWREEVIDAEGAEDVDAADDQPERPN